MFLLEACWVIALDSFEIILLSDKNRRFRRFTAGFLMILDFLTVLVCFLGFYFIAFAHLGRAHEGGSSEAFPVETWSNIAWILQLTILYVMMYSLDLWNELTLWIRGIHFLLAVFGCFDLCRRL